MQGTTFPKRMSPKLWTLRVWVFQIDEIAHDTQLGSAADSLEPLGYAKFDGHAQLASTLGLIVALTFGFNSIRDMLAKLERDAKILEDKEVTGDMFFNFVITGYSMIDWVKRDPSVPSSAKAGSVVQALYTDHWLKVCGDLATAAKHFTLTTRTPITDSAKTESGFDVGRFGMGGFGVGEESIEIKLNDGTQFNGLDLVRGVLATWKSFFQVHGI